MKLLSDNPAVTLTLSALQRQLLADVAAGRSNTDIAERLGQTPDSVRTLLAELCAVFAVDSRRDLLRAAERHGHLHGR